MIDHRLKLYKHNLDGYEKVKGAYDAGEDVVGIVHATGTGKTLIFLQLCLDNPDKKILLVAPSNAIIEHVLSVIEECGLSKEKDFPNLEFCTYQSLTTKSDEELANLDIDLLALDEFHHIGAPVWGEKIDTIVNTHEKMKIFGMTAYTVRDRGTVYERDMALDGGDELFSDKIVSRYDLVDAMCDGVLPIPNYKSAYISLMEEALELEQELLNSKRISTDVKQKYLKLIQSCKEQIDKAPGAKDLIRQNIQPGDKCIYFCPIRDGVILKDDEILGTNDVPSIRNRVGQLALDKCKKIILYETTSDMGESGLLNRDHFYNDTSFFRNEDVSNILRIMFAKNQYNEGVHAPGVTKVFLARPTNSDIVFFEQIGRALTAKGNIVELTQEYDHMTIEELQEVAKKQGINISSCNTKEEIIERLLAPTIIDLVGNIEFIKNLKDNLIARIKERHSRGIPTKITKELVDVSFNIEVENQNLYEILQNIKNDVSNLTWEDWYDLAVSYYKEHNNLKVPQDYVTKTGKKLGNWITNQRQAYKEGQLEPDKIVKLEAIRMVWYAFKAQWNNMYKLAQEYYEENNNLKVPQGYVTKTEENLGNWITNQRQAYKEGKLEPDKIAKLEAIGMVWNTFKDQWNNMYKLAQEYYEENNNLKVPFNYVTKIGENLGKWIITQRIVYKEGKLEPDKIVKLEAIGMVWDVFRDQWNNMYKLAQEYYEEHNNLKVPFDYVMKTGENLGNWIRTQRKVYKEGKLEPDKIVKLEAIGMEWPVVKIKEEQLTWKEWYDLAVSYYEENNNLKVPAVYVTKTGENLGNWISTQRKVYKEGKLEADKIVKLEAIGMVWDAFKDQWNNMYKC